MPPSKPRVRRDQWGNIIIPSDHHGFSRVMCNDYLCNIVLGYVDHHPTLWSLLNVNRCIRASLLTYHFHHYKRVIIMRLFMPSHWPMPHPTQWTINDERHKHRMIASGRWPKNKKYFERFTDFNFEEFVIGKVLRIPYWFAPTLDTSYSGKMEKLGLNLTTLTLDGTAVTGRGLFGSVSQPMSNDIYRTSPGLISYIAHHLENLSVKNCPNIQHSDIAIYLLLPPSDSCQLANLTTLRCFNSGEAPTHGPFHNLPGYGSKNLITQKSDNILNIQILALLFPRVISPKHHSSTSIPLTFPGYDPQGTARRHAYARFDNLTKSGWFDPKILTQFPPPLTLTHPETGHPIPGPFGGFISTMHESLMLKSISKVRNINLDWGLCCMGSFCVTFSQKSFAPLAKINTRTGRTVQVGNVYGALVGGKLRRQDYFHAVDGVKPRIPVALSALIPTKLSTHLPTRGEVSHAPNDPPQDAHPDDFQRFRPRFLGLAGPVPGPDYDDPKGEGDKVLTVTGLSGEGLHTHSCAGKTNRRERGGKECVNCGLWEYENYVWTYEETDSEDDEMEDDDKQKEGEEEEEKPRKTKLVRVKDPGRRIIGELCEVCVPFFTCGDCGDFYCPSCLIRPRVNDRPNPWASQTPHPDLMRHPCRIHGGTCEACFFAYRYECQKCQKYVCVDCIDENLADPGWKRCSVCDQFVCKACNGETPDGATEIMTCKEACGAFGVGHEFCLNCLGGICRYCEETWCSPCFRSKQDQFMRDHRVTMTKDEYSCFTCQRCFEYQLQLATNEFQRTEVWKFVGVNIAQREMKKVKLKELEYATDAETQRIRASGRDRVIHPIGAISPRTGNRVSSGLVQDMDLDSIDESDESEEFSSSSSGYSSSSTSPEKSGKNHRIIKAMDALYPLLGTLLGRGKPAPNGTAELMQAIRAARKSILARKLAEQSYRHKRQYTKHPRKRVKNGDDPALRDPALEDNQKDRLDEIYRHVMPMGALTASPLRNIADDFMDQKVREGLEWVPSDKDRRYWESRINDVKSEYFLADEDLTELDFAVEEEKKDGGEKDRRREWDRTGSGVADWRVGYKPADWEDRKTAGVKRAAEESSSEEEDVLTVKMSERKKMKQGLKNLRKVLKEMQLKEGRGSDGKPLKVETVIPEQQKRETREPGKMWVTKETKRKEEEMKKQIEEEWSWPPEDTEESPKQITSKSKRKKQRKRKDSSTEEDVLIDSMIRLMPEVRAVLNADAAEPPARVRGNAVRFGEASGQDPPGAARRIPVVLDGRERETYQD
ncbi:hypothetical protein TWF281_001403 [Arthrobotrys megalospora]